MLKIKQESNYLASIVKLGKPIPHPNADRLIGFIINHEIVYTDLTYKEGDVCVLFPLGSKINNELLSFLNAFRDPTKNRDTTVKGYFEDKGRVRAQPLRGEPSNGVIFKIETLEDFLQTKLSVEVGTEFDSYDDITICDKYIPPVQKEKQGGGSNTQVSKKKIEHIVDKQFAFHYDTNHFKKVVEQFQPHDVVSISYKLHGCVSEDTIVDTLEYGKQTIKHIVDNRIVCNIKAYDVYTQEVVYVPIDDYYFKSDDGDWYEITLEDGTKLEITSNNPVWLPELQCYRKVEELIIGDKLLKI